MDTLTDVLEFKLDTTNVLESILKANGEFILRYQIVPCTLVVSNKDICSLKTDKKVLLLMEGRDPISDEGRFLPLPWFTVRESAELESGMARLESPPLIEE